MIAILEQNLPALELGFGNPIRLADGTTGKQAQQAPSTVRAALAELGRLPFLATEVKRVLSNRELIGSSLPLIIGGLEQADKLQTDVSNLWGHGHRMLQALKQAAGEESPTTVFIELPPVTTFSELKSVVGDLEVVCLQKIFSRLGAFPQITGVDTGSMYIGVELTNEHAVFFLLLLYSAAQKYLAKRRQTEQSMKEMLEIATAEQRKVVELLIDQRTAADRDRLLGAALPPTATPEERSEASEAFDRVTGLVSAGSRAIPALNAPTPILEQFEEIMAIQDLVEIEQAPQLPAWTNPPLLEANNPTPRLLAGGEPNDSGNK